MSKNGIYYFCIIPFLPEKGKRYTGIESAYPAIMPKIREMEAASTDTYKLFLKYFTNGKMPVSKISL